MRLHVKCYRSSSIDRISRRVQDLVERINNSRTSDQEVMDSFQEKLVEKVENLFRYFWSYTYAGVHNSVPKCTRATSGVFLTQHFLPEVSEVCQQMKEHMYTVYEDNSAEMQVKLQELTEVLESCTKLNKELMEASQALAGLREGLAIGQMTEPR